MRRPLVIGLMLLLLDQATKTAAMYLLPGRRLLLAPPWGLTYTVNRGVWLDNQMAPGAVGLLMLLSLLIVVVAAVSLRAYHCLYRRSFWLDLGYGFLLALVLGNGVVDRLWVGGARDFLATPLFVMNLADIYGSLAALSLVAEFIAFPKARNLLRIRGASGFRRDFRFLWRVARHEWWRLELRWHRA